MLLFKDADAAQSASAVLAPWLIHALLADPAVPALDREIVPALGEAVIWALSGTMTSSNGETRKRADLGWRRGAILGFAVAFGNAEVVEMCAAAAGQMDARIDG
jgi:hypothetical protein